MHFVRTPFFIRVWYAEGIWNKPRDDNKIYLTFDDGPIPDITPWILDILKEYKVKATFFCVGENIQKHPDIFLRIREEGHQIGNHTYNHLKGWNTEDSTYLDNVKKCQELTGTALFRPPYGKAKKSQLKILKKSFDIIMWDVLSGDYDTDISAEQCLKNVVKYTKNGSIIVFHDSLKAQKNVWYALPKAIEYLLKKGYVFDTL